MSAYIFGWSAKVLSGLHKITASAVLLAMVLSLMPVGGVQFVRADQLEFPGGEPGGSSSSAVVYDALPVPLDTSYPSQPFQAQQTFEFGDYVHLAGTERLLDAITVTMVNWAKASTPANLTFCEDSIENCDDEGYFWPLTVNIYSNHVDAGGSPDELLATKTITAHIPWRPESDPSCGPTSNGTGWKIDDTCYDYSGFASNVTFDLSDLAVVLPDDVIVGFSYNTQTYGDSPTGVDGPYNSLNIAVPPGNPVTVGTDDSSDETFWNTATVGWYSSDCPGNTFCKDTNWNPYGTVAMQITANPVPLPDPGSIEITKYNCPVGTVVNRDDNGVDGEVPEGCRLQEGAYFGYVHGTQTDAGAPYTEWSEPVTPAGATNADGLLAVEDVSPEGRYVIFETDESNVKFADNELFGLYCEGDADPDPNHNDNGDILFVPEGGVGKCVAYNIGPVDTSTVLFVNDPKYVRVNNGGDLSAQIVAPTWVEGVRFYVDSTDSDPISGTNIGGAAANTDWWRLYTPIPLGPHTIYATVLFDGVWYEVSDTGIVYAVGAPEGSFVIPSATNNVFRPNDNPLRVNIDDTYEQFGRVKFTINGTDYTTNRADCDLRQAGNYVLCDIDAASNWSGLAEGTYTSTAIIYTRANSHTTITSESFTIDGTAPLLSNLTLDPDQETYDDTVHAAADATDVNGIENVTFYITVPRESDGMCTGNGEKLVTEVDQTGSGDSYSSDLDLTGIVDGEYCVNAIAKDTAANHSIILKQKITVLHTLPTLIITNPALDGDIVSGTYNFSAQYDNGVTETLPWAIRWGADIGCRGGTNVIAGNWGGYTYPSTFIGNIFTTVADTVGWDDGEYCFAINDNAGGNRDTKQFIVDNTAPAAPVITSPENNWVFNSTPILNEWTEVTQDENDTVDASGIATYQIAYLYEDGHTFGGSTCPLVTEINGSPVSGCRNTTNTSRNHTPGISEQGGVTIYVRAIDNAGNVGQWSESVYYVYDVEATGSGPINTEAHLTIIKETTDESDGTFEFVITDADEQETSAVLATEEGVAVSDTYNLVPGSTLIDEVEQEGWALTGVVCEYDDEDGSPAYTKTETGVEVSLAVGESVTCTFTNEPVSIAVDEYYSVHHGDLATSFADVLSDTGLWFFYNDETDTIDNTLGTFVTGLGAPVFGEGSAQISVTGTERRNLATYRFYGTPLEQVTALEFSTFNPAAGNGGSTNRSAYLNFNVDFDGSDTWQKRIAFVPNQNGTVMQDTWQTWDAINDGSALWWWSGFAANGNEWPDGNTSEYRTWNSILSAFPDARIRVSDGWLGLRVGEPYADGYTENIDHFLITIDDGSTATTSTFDFEPNFGTQTVITNASDLENNPSTFDDPYIVEWSVTPSSGSATPTGTVAITVNGGAGCSAPATDGECSITPASVDTVTLQAFFTGDPGYDDSSSDMVTHEIIEAPITPSGGGGGGGNGQIVGSSFSAPGFVGGVGGDGSGGTTGGTTQGSGTEGGSTGGGTTNTGATDGGTSGNTGGADGTGGTTSEGTSVTLGGGTTITGTETPDGGTELTITNEEGDTVTINSGDEDAANQLAAAQASGLFDDVPEWAWWMLLALLLLGAGGYYYWGTVRTFLGA